MLPLLPMPDDLAEVLILSQQILGVGCWSDAGASQGGLDIGDAPRCLPPEELGGVPERIGGRGCFQEDVGVGVDPEVVAQQTAVCRDGDQLVALDVTVAAFSARAGQLQGSPVLEVGGHLVVGHALDRPRGVPGLHQAQGVSPAKRAPRQVLRSWVWKTAGPWQT